MARPRAARSPGPGSRHIPATVRRAVWKRDGGQCAFVGAHGRRRERGFLEFHHVLPYAAGGQAVLENVELRCRAHNVHEAEQSFGDRLPLLVREPNRPAYRFPTRSGPGAFTQPLDSAEGRLHLGRLQPSRNPRAGSIRDARPDRWVVTQLSAADQHQPGSEYVRTSRCVEERSDRYATPSEPA